VKKPNAPRDVSRAPLSPALRRYLYFTAALAGGVLMVVEILGAKLLSPYLGTSHFVWVAQIGVTLVALATGYYLGGRLADASPRLGRLYGAMLFVAGWLSLTPPACEPVAFFCLEFRLAVGTVLASAILFFVPLTLLAMPVPFLVRTISDNLVNLGAQVGRLSAISTLGSFLGTALIGYLLIPLLPNSTTMLLNAALLAALGTGYFIVWGRPARSVAGLSAAWIVLAAAAYGAQRTATAQLAGTRELFRGNSHFGLIQVAEAPNGTRFYMNDFLTQNTYDPEHEQSTSLFTFMLSGLARAYAPRVESALCIGMGVGIVPMDFARSGARVTVVEINPAVVPVAEKFFDFETSRVSLVIDDGRHFLNRDTNRYDAILLDAFIGDSSPGHLMSREAFAAMSRRLTPAGVLVINSFGEFETHQEYLSASLDKTLRAVFRQVRIHASGNGNVFFVATNQPELKTHHPLDIAAMHPTVRVGAQTAWERTLEMNPSLGRVLTDDFNPVEYYDAANRELLRKQLVSGMRGR
jgi:spermidine synthase